MTAGTAEDLLDAIRSAHACMADIRELSLEVGGVSQEQIDSMLRGFLDNGEDRALSRLLHVCAFNRVKLDPQLLCECIGMCEDILDSAPCFAFQDEGAVEPLLAAATAEALSTERQSYAAGLAAELTVKFGLEAQPARKVLWKLQHMNRSPHIQAMIAKSLQLLEGEAPPDQVALRGWSDLMLEELLPEHRPRAVIGGTYTARRPVPKLGRNDPCHCGSGKKYKKCCFDKDQELLRDASPYAGATKTDLKARPGLVDDPAVILDMRAHELKKLSPAALSEGQLYAGYQRALTFGLRELAFEMLLEWQRRAPHDAFDPGHFEDLIEEVLQAGDLALARRIRDHCGDQTWWRPNAIQFRFDLLEHPERFEPLERECQKAVCEISEQESEFDEPLTRLAHDFAAHHPALAITFARAAIASHPEHRFDNEMLLDVIRDARIDLDLEPGTDPAEDLFEWVDDRDQRQERVQKENTEIARLSEKLDATLRSLDENRRALRETEEALGLAGAELEKSRAQAAAKPETSEPPRPFDAEKEVTLKRLRSQVADLKAEIGEQQAERRQLRKLLAHERERLAALSAPDETPQTLDTGPGGSAVEPAGRPIVPEYSDTFRKRCCSLPPPLVAKALLAAGRFAAQEPAIWGQTKALERLPGHFRIRLGLDYRMIVRWEPGKTLQILDVISRQDLESWIRRQQ